MGRDEVIGRTWEALVSGPGHPDLHQALIGEHGVGKTVLAQLVGTRAADELSWAVVNHHAIAGEDSLQAMVRALPSALSVWGRRGREFRQLEKQVTLGVNLGVLGQHDAAKPRQSGAHDDGFRVPGARGRPVCPRSWDGAVAKRR